MSSKFWLVSLLLPMSLFLTLVSIQDVTIPVRTLYIPFSRLTLCQRSFFHLGPKLWNKLPENTASCVTLPAFKAAVKAIIMDKLSFVFSCPSIYFGLMSFFIGFIALFDCLGFPLIQHFCTIGYCLASAELNK